MKKLFVLIAIIALLIPFSAIAEETKEIQQPPEYSLEGVKPFIKYTSYKDEGIIKEEIFSIDRNNDGVVDIVYEVASFFSEPGNSDMFECVTAVIMIDVDFDGEFDRTLLDNYDSSGSPGMDGKFDSQL